MHKCKCLIARITLFVLGLSSVVHAQSTVGDTGPVWCPPLNSFLTPTLLDWLIRPDFTSR